MKFDDLVNELLTEMPHVALDLSNGEHLDFDLELEHIKTLEELEAYYIKILSGEEIIPHRRELPPWSLKTHEEKVQFMKDTEDFLSNFLQYKKFNITVGDFYKKLHTNDTK